ncbi:MAG: hypothetical protein NWR45_10720 [Candidatus Nanopelagicales bacterium]|nr:hypothetical protein [Candidatus Nanopelagicales bacterium]
MNKTHSWSARSIASLLVFVLAALLTPVAIVGHWGHRTFNDPAQYLATVVPLASDEAVQESLSTAISDAILARVDTEELVSGFLGNLLENSPITDALAGPISAGIESLIREAVAGAVASEEFANAWRRLNEVAQKSIVAALSGEPSGPVDIRGDELVLDISELVTGIQQGLVDKGITAAGNFTIPEKDREIVLFSSPVLGQIRTIYAFTNPILEWVLVMIAALFLIAFALSRRRARTITILGGYLIVIGITLQFALAQAAASFNNQLEGTVFGPAAEAFWTIFAAYLLDGLTSAVVLGIVLIGAAWFSSNTSSGRAVRGAVLNGLRTIGESLPEGFAGIAGAVTRNTSTVLWVIAVLWVFLVFEGQAFNLDTGFWVTLLALGFLTVLGILRGVRTPAPATPASGLDA